MHILVIAEKPISDQLVSALQKTASAEVPGTVIQSWQPAIERRQDGDIPAEAFVKFVANLTASNETTDVSAGVLDDAVQVVDNLISQARKVAASIAAEAAIEERNAVHETIVNDLGLNLTFLGTIPQRRINQIVSHEVSKPSITTTLWVEYLAYDQQIRVCAEAGNWQQRKTYLLDISREAVSIVKEIIAIAQNSSGAYLTDQQLQGLAPYLQTNPRS